MPFEGRGLNSVIRASGHLKLSPDLDVFAWLCERWLSVKPFDIEGVVPFTLRGLGTDIYGRPPGYVDRRAMRESLRRLYRVEIQFAQYDSIYGQPGKFGSLDRLVQNIVTDLDPLEGDWAAIGAMRGSSYRITLAPWMRERLVAGSFSYLDWRVLRQLDGIAKRVAVYLAAERFKPCGDGQVATHVGLGGPALASLGADNFTRHRAARAALNKAGKRIMGVDPRYASIKCERRPGGWSLIAVRRSRVDANAHADVRAEIAASLAAAQSA